MFGMANIIKDLEISCMWNKKEELDWFAGVDAWFFFSFFGLAPPENSASWLSNLLPGSAKNLLFTCQILLSNWPPSRPDLYLPWPSSFPVLGQVLQCVGLGCPCNPLMPASSFDCCAASLFISAPGSLQLAWFLFVLALAILYPPPLCLIVQWADLFFLCRCCLYIGTAVRFVFGHVSESLPSCESGSPLGLNFLPQALALSFINKPGLSSGRV